MTKKILLLLCIPALLPAMDRTNPGLDLVTHNNGENYTNYFPLRELWGHISDVHTREVTTMDITPHISKTDNHITGDVCTYPFKVNSIKRVYMERPPTFGNDDNDQGSYLGKAIKNVATGMCPGAMLEIELHPFSEMTCDPKKALMEYKWPLFGDIKNDSFTAKIDSNLFFMAFDIACNGMGIAMKKRAEKNWSPPAMFMTHALKLSKIIEELLTFYEKQGVGKKELLKKHLNRETYILELFAKQPQIMLLHNGPQSGPEKFLSTADSQIDALPLTPENWQQASRLLAQKIIYDGRQVYTENEFITASLANFILCDAFIIETQDNIKNSMKDNGFIFPIVERKTSSYNGRKNVYIISALKSLSAQQVVALDMLQRAHKAVTLGILQYIYGVNKNV